MLYESAYSENVVATVPYSMKQPDNKALYVQNFIEEFCIIYRFYIFSNCAITLEIETDV